ncbi:MAG: lysophospholipid acyltransferase family protein [bacterium]
MTTPATPPPGWSSRSLGNRFQHGIFQFLIRLGGQRAAMPLLYAVALYYVLLRPAVRRRFAPYLSRRFPGTTAWQRLGLAYRLAVEFGTVLIDRAAVGICGFDANSTTLSGRETLLALLAEGHGAVLLTAHVGCWQIVMAALSFIRVPVHLLMVREEGDLDRHYFEYRGLACPFQIIDPSGFLGGSIELLQALKRGDMVSIMGDRMFGSRKNAVAVPFVGDTAQFPVSPFKIAAAAGAPVVVVLSHRTGPARYHLEVAKVIRVPNHPHLSPAELGPLVAQYSQCLDDYVTRHPFQFFNFSAKFFNDV